MTNRVPVHALEATGTRSSSTYLNGAGAWTVPAGGGGGAATPATVSGSASGYVSTSTGAVTIPATATEGDWLLLFAAHNFTPNTPAGWVEIAGVGATQYARGALFFRRCTASDPGTNVQVTFSGSGAGELGIVAVSGGGRLVDLRDAQWANGGATSTSFQIALPAAGANDLEIFFFAARATSPTITATPGTTLETRTDPAWGLVVKENQALGGPEVGTASSSVGATGWYAAAVAIVGV